MSARSRRSRVQLTLTLCLMALLAACSTGGESSIAPANSAVASAPAIAIPTSTPAAEFPVTVTGHDGIDVEVKTEPAKIVSLTPAITETLFAIGVGDLVVATDDGSDFPAEAAALPDVATFGGVDVEEIVALAPDLAFAGGEGFTSGEAIDRLRSLGIPVVVLYQTSVANLYEDIELIGTTVGQVDSAADLVEAMRSEIDAISAAVASGTSRPRVFYEVSYVDTTGQIYAPGENSFLADVVTLAGADPILGNAHTYEIPLETLIQRDPEIIVLGVNPFYAPTAEGVASRPGWAVMTAVRNGKIVPVRDIEINRPGPRLPEGLRNLAAAIWPDVSMPAAG